MEFVDTHCHIDFNNFDPDREPVLARAAAAGVKRLVNPGADMEASRRAVAMAHTYPNVYAAVGLDHGNAPQVNQSTLAQLAEMASDPKVVAIGEIGLDYHWDFSPRPEQRRALEAQLGLAGALNLPVIIHQREAAADTMAILRSWAAGGAHPGLVLHAFSGDAAMVEEAVELGFYMSIAGPITFTNAKNYPDVVSRIPLDHLLTETDAPFLSPHPHRGARNEPARVVLVAQKLATIFGLETSALALQTTANAQALFKLPPAV